MGVADKYQAPLALHLKKSPRIHCTGGWVNPRPFLDGCEEQKISALTGFQIPNHTARSESLYQFPYPIPFRTQITTLLLNTNKCIIYHRKGPSEVVSNGSQLPYSFYSDTFYTHCFPSPLFLPDHLISPRSNLPNSCFICSPS